MRQGGTQSTPRCQENGSTVPSQSKCDGITRGGYGDTPEEKHNRPYRGKQEETLGRRGKGSPVLEERYKALKKKDKKKHWNNGGTRKGWGRKS